MVHEEYLNPEFMWRCINTLCKQDGYVLKDFSFGRLELEADDQPILMKNDYGYNMVYRFEVWKAPELIKGFEKSYDGVWIDTKYIESQLIKKVIYFDINNECFVEKPDHKYRKEYYYEYPSCFSLNGQWYYAIHNQPKVLKCHSTERAKKTDNMRTYMEHMGATAQNILNVDALIYNVYKPKSMYPKVGWNILFKSESEANTIIKEALTKPHDCIDFVQINEAPNSIRWEKHTYKIKEHNRFKINVHNDDVPVFYTSNTLELTVPITEALCAFANDVTHTFRDIRYTLRCFRNTINRFVGAGLSDVPEDVKDNYGAKVAAFYALHRPYYASFQIEDLVAWASPSEAEIFGRHMAKIDKGIKDTSKSIEKLELLCKKIDQLNRSHVSLDKLLDISNIIEHMKQQNIQKNKTR